MQSVQSAGTVTQTPHSRLRASHRQSTNQEREASCREEQPVSRPPHGAVRVRGRPRQAAVERVERN